MRLPSQTKPTLFKPNRVPPGVTFRLERKYDGVRLLVRPGEAYLRSRKENIWGKLSGEVHALVNQAANNLGSSTIWFDGELTGGKYATDVASILAHGGDMRLWFFDIPELPADEAWSILQHLSVPTPVVYTSGPALRLLEYAEHLMERDAGLEGVVFKAELGPARLWYKLKREHTEEAVVIGLLPGGGKYRGMVGSLLCRTREGQHVRISGFTDEQRKALSKADIGRVVEFAYQDRGSQGGYRHPRFKRWRSDRSSLDD